MNILENPQRLAEEYGEDQLNVRVEIPNESVGFALNNKTILTNDKSKSIDWHPYYTIEKRI